jgi:(p)ppGpp synthase/HD superfamily hydrolase
VFVSSALEAPREPKLGDRFGEALVYAHQMHRFQWRKGTDRPYISHLLGVTAIVLQHGGDEDQAIAALLHDVVEDCGGAPRLEEIREKFGERVAHIVHGCTDSLETPRPPHEERKRNYVERARKEGPEIRLVSAADKLYNAREVLMDFRAHGESIFWRFKGGREGTLRYYRALVGAFREGEPVPFIDELDTAVTELEALAAAAPAR